MKNSIVIACLLIAASLSAAKLEWKTERGAFPNIVELRIETLNNLISAYFKSDDGIKHSFIIRSSPLLKRGEIFSSLQKGKTDIHIPDAIEDLDSKAMFYLASLFIARQMKAPNQETDFYLPDWIPSAFVYRTNRDIRKPIIKLPYFPMIRSVMLSERSFDIDALLRTEDLGQKSQFLFELKSEIGWAILSSLKKNSSGTELIAAIADFCGQSSLTDTKENTELLQKKCISDEYFSLVKQASINIFFPYPPSRCIDELQSMTTEFLGRLKNEDKNNDGSFEEKDKALKKFISALLEFRAAIPPFSRKPYHDFCEKISSFKGEKKFSQVQYFLEKSRIGDIFAKDKAVYDFLLNSEKKTITPGKKYFMILNELEKKTVVELGDIIKE